MAITDTALRPRTATELMDAAVALARVDYPALLLIAGTSLLVQLPVSVAYTRMISTRQWLGAMAIFLAQIAISGVFNGAGIVAASDGYLGRPMEVGRSLATAFRHAIPLVRVTVAAQLAIMLGLIALIFPGLVAMARFFAVQAAVVLEDTGCKRVMDRSRELAAGNERRILGALLPLTVVTWALSWSGSAVAHALGAGRAVETIAGEIASAWFYPVLYGLIVALYYDARIRNEAFDLALMLEEAPAPVP